MSEQSPLFSHCHCEEHSDEAISLNGNMSFPLNFPPSEIVVFLIFHFALNLLPPLMSTCACPHADRGGIKERVSYALEFFNFYD